jgi:hypothetical protein
MEEGGECRRMFLKFACDEGIDEATRIECIKCYLVDGHDIYDDLRILLKENRSVYIQISLEFNVFR